MSSLDEEKAPEGTFGETHDSDGDEEGETEKDMLRKKRDLKAELFDYLWKEANRVNFYHPPEIDKFTREDEFN